MTPTPAVTPSFSRYTQAGYIPATGSSDEAQYVAKQSERSRHRLRESNSLGSGIEVAFEELLKVAGQCSSPNWDGYGAAPVSHETIRQARRFLEVLPLGTPAPSVGAEPDGHITFEWYKSARRVLSVSISPEGDLHYAALFGLSKTYGTEPFFGEMPQAILNLVYRVFA